MSTNITVFKCRRDALQVIRIPCWIGVTNIYSRETNRRYVLNKVWLSPTASGWRGDGRRVSEIGRRLRTLFKIKFFRKERYRLATDTDNSRPLTRRLAFLTLIQHAQEEQHTFTNGAHLIYCSDGFYDLVFNAPNGRSYTRTFYGFTTSSENTL